MTMTDLTRMGESRGVPLEEVEEESDDEEEEEEEEEEFDDLGGKDAGFSNDEDVNAALHVENSVFPRGRRSEKARKGGLAVSATSGTTGQSGAGAHTGTASTGLTPSTQQKHNLLQVPPPQGLPSPVSDADDSGEESDDEGAAILGNNKRFNAKANNRGLNTSDQNALSTSSFLNSPPNSGASANENGNAASETFVKDGVHVTAL